MNLFHHSLGILGGMGPAATAYFFDMVIRMTAADCDQQHLNILLYNCASTPDRSRYLLGQSSENPLKVLLPAVRELAAQQVACIAIPCVTSCAFYDDIAAVVNVPVIHTVRETAAYLKRQGVSCVGIMATSGAVSTGLFQAELTTDGIRPVIPSREAQQKVMSLIFSDVKAGRPPHMQRFYDVSRELRKNGAEVIILGCTELSTIKRDYDIGAGYIDALEVLAQCSVLMSGGKLLPQYTQLISSAVDKKLAGAH